MHKIFTALVAWLLRLAEARLEPDIEMSLSARDWADLPTHHPHCSD